MLHSPIFRPNSVSAKEVILCWNSNSDEVAIVPFPDTDRLSKDYDFTALACYADMRYKSFEELKTIVFIEAMHLIVRDGCDPVAVHKALSAVKEYCDGCANDMPLFVGDNEKRMADLPA